MITILVVVFATLAFRAIQGRSAEPAAGGRHEPLDILKERCARGDLSEEEFERRRRTVEGPAT